MNARSTAWLLAVAATALAALVAWRGVALVADGGPVAVLIGLGVIAVVAVAAGLVVSREVGFGLATQRLGKELASRRRASHRTTCHAAHPGGPSERPPTRRSPPDETTSLPRPMTGEVVPARDCLR